MNVQPAIHTHPKFLALQSAVGIGAMHYLTRLWAFCQQEQRGERIGRLSPEVIESLCGWTGEPGKLFAALTTPVAKKGAGWLVVNARTGECVVHDWNKENAGLVSNWRNGRTSQRRFSKSGRGGGTAPAMPAHGSGSAPALHGAIGVDGSGVDRMGSEGSGSDRRGGGTTRAREPLSAPPTLEQALAYGRQTGWPYDEATVRLAWLSFEAAKLPDGSWAWGKRAVTDWRSALERRLADEAEKPAPHAGAINGRLVSIGRRLAEIENSPAPEHGVERRQLKREQADLLEKQRKAAGQ